MKRLDPSFLKAIEMAFDTSGKKGKPIAIDFELRDVIVMSQTCDMVKGRESISEVLLCSVWKKADFKEGLMSKRQDWNEARKGRMPGFHVLNECNLPGPNWDFSVVDFRRVHSLPLDLVRKKTMVSKNRIRLLPPYREHLSQAFARFFMRVGLPVNVPAF